MYDVFIYFIHPLITVLLLAVVKLQASLLVENIEVTKEISKTIIKKNN